MMEIIITMGEEFKPITYPKVKDGMYEISNYGNVRNSRTKRIMKSFEHNGYLRIQLVSNGMKKKQHTNVAIHRLVAWEFCKGYRKGYVVNHKNSNRKDNYYMNLEWCTEAENIAHAIKTGNILIGESHNWSKFTEKTIRKICRYLEKGLTNKEIMKKFGFKKNN